MTSKHSEGCCEMCRGEDLVEGGCLAPKFCPCHTPTKSWEEQWKEIKSSYYPIPAIPRGAMLEVVESFIRETIAKEREEASEKYHELILAVGNKHPNETRHETALRYIRQAEEGSSEAASSPQRN